MPLGTPLLAGPGAIVATMLEVQQSSRPADYIAVALALVAIAVQMIADSLRAFVTTAG